MTESLVVSFWQLYFTAAAAVLGAAIGMAIGYVVATAIIEIVELISDSRRKP